VKYAISRTKLQEEERKERKKEKNKGEKEYYKSNS